MGQPFFEVLFVLVLYSVLKRIEFLLEGEMTSLHCWLLSLENETISAGPDYPAEKDDYARKNWCL